MALAILDTTTATHDNSLTGYSVTTQSCSVDDLMLMCHLSTAPVWASTITAPTVGGVAMTPIHATNSPYTAQNLYLAAWVKKATGSGTMQIDFHHTNDGSDGTSVKNCIIMTRLSGQDLTDPIGGGFVRDNDASGSTNTHSVTVPSATGNLVFAFMGWTFGSPAISALGTGVSLVAELVHGTVRGGLVVKNGAASVTLGQSQQYTTVVAMGFDIKVAGAAGGSNLIKRKMMRGITRGMGRALRIS